MAQSETVLERAEKKLSKKKKLKVLMTITFYFSYIHISSKAFFPRVTSPISSVGRALNLKTGCCGFDSQAGQPNNN